MRYWITTLFLLIAVTVQAAPPYTAIQVRRDTPTNWASYNPVLAAGEVGCEMTGSPSRCTAQKVGDGVTAWTGLPYTSIAARAVQGRYSGVTLSAEDIIVKGPVVDVRAFMDGKSGRPTLGAWQAAQTTTDVSLAVSAAQDYLASKVGPDNGGIVFFPAGIYIHTGMTMRSWVSLMGAGTGTTILRLASGTTANAVTFPAGVILANLSDLTVDGNASNNVGAGGHGVYFASVASGAGGSRVPYNKTPQATYAYKYANLERVTGTNCTGDGLHMEFANFAVFGTQLHWSYNNGHGAYIAATDCIFTNSYYEHNGKAGLYNSGSNNKFSDSKAIWNGTIDNTFGAVRSVGARNNYANFEAQDNYTHGFYNYGPQNTFVSCISDNNGYSAPGAEGVSSRTHSGFYNSGSDAAFSACKVVSYKYPAVGSGDGLNTCEYPYYFATLPTKYDIQVQAGDPGVCNSHSYGGTDYKTEIFTDATAQYSNVRFSIGHLKTANKARYDILSTRLSAGTDIGQSSFRIRRNEGVNFLDILIYDEATGLLSINGGSTPNGLSYGNVRIPNGTVTIDGTLNAGALAGAAITDSTTTSSSTIAASAKAVKITYDLAASKAAPAFSGVTANIGGEALNAGAVVKGTVAVMGATTGMVVVVSPVAYPGDGAVWSGHVSSTNTVTVEVTATKAMTPIATAYNVRVLQ